MRLGRAVKLIRLLALGAWPLGIAIPAVAGSGSPPQPPALDPPSIVRDAATTRDRSALQAIAPYSHGEPSAEEQYMLEFINRARSNPAAEGLRLKATTDPGILDAYSYFQVDLDKMVADFAGYPSRPPLAFNANLIAAARGHSQDMAGNDFQGHTGSNGSSMAARIGAAGYTGWNALAENVYAYAKSVFYGHAGFNADWGVPGLGHRQNIMNFSGAGPVYTEIGIGIVGETSPTTGVGPLVVTEDFGRRSGQLFMVGVVYDDRDRDGFYSVGEGLAGITVTTSQGNYAHTSASGGYAVPVADGSSSIVVRAEGDMLGVTQEFSVSLAGTNVKVDFVARTARDQTIAFGAAPGVVVGGGGTVSATATSGLAVAFSSLTTGVCTVAGSTVIGVSAGVCTIAADQAGNVNYNPAPRVMQTLFVLQPGSTSLRVTQAGAGGGTVTSSPPGILCGEDCSDTYTAGTRVTLTATPTAGSVFVGWGGACSGTLICTLSLGAAADITATFAFVGTGSADSNEWVQKSYLAYYGRPADPDGLAYWAGRMDREGGSLASIIGSFGTSAEFNRRYSGLGYIELVTRIYQQALGREPEQGGLDYYVIELQAGRRTLQAITLDVLNGATGTDALTVANRLDVANHYTGKVAAGCSYGTEQTGVASLATVTPDSVTVSAAKAAIESRCGI